MIAYAIVVSVLLLDGRQGTATNLLEQKTAETMSKVDQG